MTHHSLANRLALLAVLLSSLLLPLPAQTIRIIERNLQTPLAVNFITTGIVGGPDGAVWFLELTGSNRIARLTVGGAITHFSLPQDGNGIVPTAMSIVLGPDGAFWFPENHGGTVDKIGRMTTSG